MDYMHVIDFFNFYLEDKKPTASCIAVLASQHLFDLCVLFLVIPSSSFMCDLLRCNEHNLEPNLLPLKLTTKRGYHGSVFRDCV